MRYMIRPLDAATWAAFAELAARNNGVYGGCWCMAYHPEVSRIDAAQNRAGKERRVRGGRAHAALVFDDSGTAQGWCQYGSPEELPGIKHKREYDKDPLPPCAASKCRDLVWPAGSAAEFMRPGGTR